MVNFHGDPVNLAILLSWGRHGWEGRRPNKLQRWYRVLLRQSSPERHSFLAQIHKATPHASEGRNEGLPGFGGTESTGTRLKGPPPSAPPPPVSSERLHRDGLQAAVIHFRSPALPSLQDGGIRGPAIRQLSVQSCDPTWYAASRWGPGSYREVTAPPQAVSSERVFPISPNILSRLSSICFPLLYGN